MSRPGVLAQGFNKLQIFECTIWFSGYLVVSSDVSVWGLAH